MGAIATLLTERLATRRSTSSNPSQWLIDWVSGGGPTASGATVNHDSALKFTPFWAAVRIISGTLGALPFKVYRHLDSGGKAPRPSHRVYRLLHDAPNEYMSALKFKESRQVQVLCYGNGYAEIQRDGGGRPVALWPLLSSKTERKLTQNGTPYYEVTLPAGGKVLLEDSNVLHVMGLSLDGYTGVDVVTYHREAIGYGMAVKEFGARFFGNGCHPGGFAEHPTVLSDKAKKHLEESLNAKFGGLTNAQRVMVLEEGMKFHENAVDPQKAQALEVQKWSVDDCSRIFQIPPHMLGSMEFSKYNNVEQLNLQFYCSTMLYWFTSWEQEVNRKLFTPSEQGALFAEILADAMLRGDADSRAKYYASGRQWGYLSINDIREKENMNPIGPAGDIYLDPMNMVPAGTPNPKASAPDGGSDNNGDDNNAGRQAVRDAHRALLISLWRRVLAKQIGALQKPTKPGFWTEHRRWARGVLVDAADAYASVSGRRLNGELDSVIDRRINGTLKETDAESLADELLREIGGE